MTAKAMEMTSLAIGAIFWIAFLEFAEYKEMHFWIKHGVGALAWFLSYYIIHFIIRRLNGKRAV